MKQPKILVVGSLVMDLIVLTTRFAERGETVSSVADLKGKKVYATIQKHNFMVAYTGKKRNRKT